MNRDEVQERLRKELNLPFYTHKGKIDGYDELEYQKIKADLAKEYLDYVDDYIDYAENDV